MRVYAGHHYGSMLWDLESEIVGQYCRVWNTAVKLTYAVPRSTHTYLVEHLLAVNFLPVKSELMSRYVKFLDSLLNNKSSEVQFLVKTALSYVRSTTSKNLLLIQQESGLNPLKVSSSCIRGAMKIAEIPEKQSWRLPLLVKLLERRRVMEVDLMCTKEISGVIDSLCSS